MHDYIDDERGLAEGIAKAIFNAPVGFEDLPPVERIQFKHSNGPYDKEFSGGGLCRKALIDAIERAISKQQTM